MTLVRGRIAGTPASGRVDVVIPSFDGGEQRFDALPFTPGATDPAPGNDCLVAFDQLDTAWLISWHG
jgi:hypothetical protein